MTQHKPTNGKLANETVAIWKQDEEAEGKTLEIYDVHLETIQGESHVRNHGKIVQTKIETTYDLKFKYLTSKSKPLWLPKSLHSITFEGDYGMETFAIVADQQHVSRKQKLYEYDPDTSIFVCKFRFKERT